MNRLSGVRILARCVLLAALGTLGTTKAGAATITVTATVDDNTANGNCTLREAINSALSDSAADLCASGSGVEPDVVVVPAGNYPINNGFFFIGSAGGPLVVRGPAVTPPTAFVDINPATSQRFMRLLTGANVTLENLQIRNGDVRTNQSVVSGGAITAADTQDVRLTLRNVWMSGNRASFGGALNYESGGVSRLLIENSVFQGNLAQIATPAFPHGGAMRVIVRDQSCARIVDSTIYLNRVEASAAGSQSGGGGFYGLTDDQSSLEIRRTMIGYNEADAGAGANPIGAGVYLGLTGGLTTLEDVRLEGNDVQGAFADVLNPAVSALEVSTSFSGSASLDRVEVIRNDVSDTAVGVHIRASSSGSVIARNMLIAAGPVQGALVSMLSGSVSLAHWTVTGHNTEGLRLARSGTNELRLDNSLLWNNGTDLAQSGGPTIDPSNLIGVNPMFVAPIADDYSLAAGSPAIDFGDRTLASMSPYDAAHGPRVDGNDTDAGAYERGAIFADGFNAGPGGYCTP
jgi:CSLREA domain-containing protein